MHYIVYASDEIYFYQIKILNTANTQYQKYCYCCNNNSNCRRIIVNYVLILYRADYLLLNRFLIVIFNIGIIINCNVMAKNKTYFVRAQIGQLVILNIDCS